MEEMKLEQQVDLLMQGTEYGDKHLKQSMRDELISRLKQVKKEGRTLRVYCGFDPRTTDLHLGHTVPMRKLRQFQDLGHEVIFLIGRFTSLVGDPSDKDKVRAQLSPEEAIKNAETYANQAFRILDPDRTRIEYNDTWLSKLTFADLIHLASNFTIQQFLSREAFRKRWDQDDPVYLHEFFYALMQGYDAFHLKTDVQVGGTDQLFNIVTAARKLMEALGEKPNIAIILGILPGTDGVVKMSKSLGNHIPLNTTPEDMYGKVMSVPDAAMGDFFRLVTRWTPPEIEAIESDLNAGKSHPRDVKMKLAREIVGIYYGEEAVKPAEDDFKQIFQQQEAPTDMPDFVVQQDTSLVAIMKDAGLVKSNSEARRLVKQKGVRLDDVVVEDADQIIEIDKPIVLRVGKRRFVRLMPDK